MKISQQNSKLLEIARLQSHHVRKPLANIMGLATLIEKENIEGENNQLIIKYIEQEAQHLDEIIKDIIDRTYKI